MANLDEERKRSQLRDIEQVDFGGTIEEITSSLEIVLGLYEIDDDPEIIQACKAKIKEGVQKLKDLGAGNQASEIQQEL